MSLQNLFPKITILFMLIGLVLWFISHNQITPSHYHTPLEAQEYMTHVTVKQFSENGSIKNKISANYWAYLPNKAFSQLEAPQLTLIKPNNTEWSIQSQFGHAHHAKLNEKISHIDLWDHVLIKNNAPNSMTVTTQALTFYPERNFVESNQFIIFQKPGVQITGTGLRGFLDKNWVELLDNVKTLYDSNSASLISG